MLTGKFALHRNEWMTEPFNEQSRPRKAINRGGGGDLELGGGDLDEHIGVHATPWALYEAESTREIARSNAELAVVPAEIRTP